MFKYLVTLIGARIPRSEKGQDLAEYGLLVALIAIIAVAGVTAFGGEIADFFTTLGTDIGLFGPQAP